jgi:hypothetical protein
MKLKNVKHQIDRLKGEAERQRAQQIDRIIKAACYYFHLSEEELLGKCRLHDACYARHIVFYLVYQYTITGHPRIAKLFSRDHTTIMFGVKKVRGLVEVGDENAVTDVGYVLKNMKNLRHVKPSNPLEYRDKRGQRRIRIAPELHKKRGRKPAAPVVAFARPAAIYSNTTPYGIAKN